MPKQIEDRLTALREKAARDRARIMKLEGQKKREDRKRDTRMKIVVGAAILGEMERIPHFADHIRQLLNAAVTRQQDRDTIAALLKRPARPESNQNEEPAEEQLRAG